MVSISARSKDPVAMPQKQPLSRPTDSLAGSRGLRVLSATYTNTPTTTTSMAKKDLRPWFGVSPARIGDMECITRF